MRGSLFYDKETLITNLKIARMNVYYKDFLANSLKVAIMMDIMVNIVIFFVLSGIAKNNLKYSVFLFLVLTIPFGFYIMFKFFVKTPEVKIIRSRKNIDAEIISAIRFVILDLKANASIYDTLQNLAKNFDEIGKYVNDIVVRVKLGSSLEASINEEVELVPSEEFRTLLWQLLSHLQTGADITASLETIVNEIAEKQRILFKKYGKKLNVLSLFYMIVAIILPTIGFTMITAALIFLNVHMDIWIIIAFWLVFTVMQLMFLALSSGNRPVVES